MSEAFLNLTNCANPVTPVPGIYKNVPYSVYQTWNCFRKSFVDAALKSGKHLEFEIINSEKSRSLSLGSLVDCLLLEPHLFSERFAIQPNTYDSEETSGRGGLKVTKIVTKPWNMNSNTCKAIAAELRASGKEIITADMYEDAVACRDSLLENNEIMRSVNCGEKQISIVWNEPTTGVLCKARLDILGDTIDDLKTAQDAFIDAFSRAAGQHLYHVQAAAYTDAVEMLTGKKKKFRFLVVETGKKTIKPQTAIYEFGSHEVERDGGEIITVPDNDSILAGRLMFQRACEKIVQYQKYGFTGYSKFPEPFSVPGYVINRELSMHEEIEL